MAKRTALERLERISIELSRFQEQKDKCMCIIGILWRLFFQARILPSKR